jgi:hypothetical protein
MAAMGTMPTARRQRFATSAEQPVEGCGAGRPVWLRLITDQRAHLALVAGIPAAWLLSLPAPPLTDFAEHSLAIAGVAESLFEKQARFEFNVQSSPYLAYHVAGALLARLVRDAALADCILVFAICLAFPLALRRLLRVFESPLEYAWFGIMPFFSRALTIGFLPYLASVPLGLILLAEARAAPNHSERPSLWMGRIARMGGLSALLFYSHISSFSIFVPAAVLVGGLWGQPSPVHGKVASAARSALWAIVPALLTLRFLLVGQLSSRPGAGLDDSPPISMSFARRLYAFPLWLFDNFRASADDAAALGFWVMFLVSSRIERRKRAVPNSKPCM